MEFNPVWIAFITGIIIGGVLVTIVFCLLTQHKIDPMVSLGSPDRPNADIHEFMFEVYREVLRARLIHPGNAHLLAALMEEVGELAKAYLEDEPPERKRAEAMQVACVAARIATEKDGDYQ